jgi:tetratricopeptide (TPR) repeat protein
VPRYACERRPPAQPVRKAWRAGVLLSAVLCGPLATAAPYLPADDDAVLEVVPAATELRQLQPLREQLARHPGDERAALALAQAYLDLGRIESDPRIVSYAQATLAPWLDSHRPDAGVLVLGASASQYLHRFGEALALLDRALQQQPQNGQAWLTRAAILQVQGRFSEAQASCRTLAQFSDALITVVCLTGVNSLTGELTASYRTLRGLYQDDPRIPAAVRVWIFDELADMAERAGIDDAAEAYLLAARRVASRDPYTNSAYADLLLRERRNTEVVQLLEADQSQDNLLLRLAIAGARLHSTQAEYWAATYQARYEAARRDGDWTHLREQARFLLEVRHDGAGALALAERNWQQQREPADVRLLVAATGSAHDAVAAAQVLEWLRQTRYEDQTLELTQLQAAGASSR